MAGRSQTARKSTGGRAPRKQRTSAASAAAETSNAGANTSASTTAGASTAGRRKPRFRPGTTRTCARFTPAESH
ncbi:unnamed protein product [Tilletia controversa]|nr:unnamed protein product [Tilletia controversa]